MFFQKHLLLLFLVLIILPADFFDSGQSVCLSVLLLDIECYGCGITRAVLSSLHLNFETAFAYNKMVVIVFPLLIYIWIKKTRSFYKKANPKSVCSKTA